MTAIVETPYKKMSGFNLLTWQTNGLKECTKKFVSWRCLRLKFSSLSSGDKVGPDFLRGT